MKDVAVSSYFLPIISAERELIGNNKLFLIFFLFIPQGANLYRRE